MHALLESKWSPKSVVNKPRLIACNAFRNLLGRPRFELGTSCTRHVLHACARGRSAPNVSSVS